MGKTERIDTRVSPETRHALEAAASANGVSLSREIEDRLVKSLNSERSRYTDRPEYDGLLSALRIVIDYVEGLTGQQWQADAFTRDCAADAVFHMTRLLGPDEDGASPPASFPTGFEWATGRLRLENAKQFIEYGVGRHAAESTITMMAAPFPKGSPHADTAAEFWWDERTAARALKGLMRVRIRNKNEQSNGE